MEAILVSAMPYIIPMIGSLISWGMIELTRFVREQTKSRQAGDAIATIGHLTEDVVAEISQTTAANMRDENGKLREGVGDILKERAMNALKGQLSKRLERGAGLVTKDMDAFLSSRIEARLNQLRVKS